MSRRIDYHDDPNAPPANRVVPSANVVVVNDTGSILLIRRTDSDNWALPGGAHALGESLIDTARRETAEETGIQVQITGLVGIYTDPATSSNTPATTRSGRNSRSSSPPDRSAVRRPQATSPARSTGYHRTGSAR